MSSYTQINSNITEPDYSGGRSGMGKKKIINRIVLVRHGETQGNQLLMNIDKKVGHKHDQDRDQEQKQVQEQFNAHTLDTNLTELGKLQASEIGEFISKINFIPDKILVSKLKRTYDTAYPTIQSLNINAKQLESGDNSTYIELSEKWIEFNSKHDETINGICDCDEWLYKRETRENFDERILEAFDDIKRIGSIEKPIQIMIFTHSQVISTILSRCISPSPSENTDLSKKNMVSFHLSNGSITCIDITEDYETHIQCVNYTKHLSIPTGHHSPFI